MPNINLNLSDGPPWLLIAISVAILLHAASEMRSPPLTPESCVTACGGSVARFTPSECVCQERPPTEVPATVGCLEMM